MSVAVCRSSTALINAPSAGMPIDNWLAQGKQQNKTGDISVVNDKKDGERSGQSDIWSMIQSQKGGAAQTAPPPPYIHPLMRRSRSLMSQKSLEMCTENLGSETGSDPLDSDDDRGWFSQLNSDEDNEIIKEKTEQHKVAKAGNVRRELDTVNYHCSISRRSPPPRSFPPPLPSISRRDGPCIQMRTRRIDGRLVVKAVPVTSKNYLHARRQDGRLVLSFIDTTFQKSIDSSEMSQQPQNLKQEQVEEQEVEEQIEAEESQEVNDDYYNDDEDEEAEGEEEEEEVEVVDRGTVVEVKVSTQPQQQNGSVKVLRSSLVINKFVGGAPLSNQNRWAEPPPTTHLPEQEFNNYTPHPQRRTASSPTTAAAAAVAASSVSASLEVIGHHPPPADSKLLFTTKRRNREELLHDMRRCSELRQPLFFWEPCCIATSS